MVSVTVGGETYAMNDTLKSKWDKLRGGKLVKSDQDRVYIVDGRERSGKSVWTLQQACYLDPSLIHDFSRICFNAESFLEAIRKNKSEEGETRVVVFDEAFRGLSSKGAISKVNKHIVQVMMEMGQNNLIVFIVSPSFFLIEMYGAVLRSNALFHIVKHKHNERRFFRAFNYKKKAVLYQRGIKKGWGYNVRTRLKGYFPNKYPGGKEFETEYRKKKFESIQEDSTLDFDAGEKAYDKHRIRFGLMCKLLKENYKVPYCNQSKYLEKQGHDMTEHQISRIIKAIPPKITI